MPHTHDLVLFIVASLTLLVVPGPAVLYIVARAIDDGRRAGVVSVLGLGAGSVVMVALAAFGVAALIAASPAAFDALRYAGAGYLAWLGIRAALAPSAAGSAMGPGGRSLRRVFWEGVLVSLSNPKSILFFFAFLPQFVNPQGSVRTQIMGLGLLFIALAVVTDGTYALVAGALGGRLRDGRFARVRRVVVPAVYLTLAVLAVLAGQTK